MRIAGLVLLITGVVAIGLVWLAEPVDGGTWFVEPLSAVVSDDGRQAMIEVPAAGGCAEEHQFPAYKIAKGTLTIWVEEKRYAFRCLVDCVNSDPGIVCSETLVLGLDPPVDPVIPIAFEQPGPGLRSIGLSGLWFGTGLWLIWIGPRRRVFDPATRYPGRSDPA